MADRTSWSNMLPTQPWPG